MTRYATLFYSFIIAILIIAGFSIPVSAQSGSIRLEGTVWDPTGTALPGAELTAVEENTGRQSNSVSDSAGYYVFLSLPPGTYTLTAKAKGFKDVVYRSVLLFSPGTVAQDLSFEVSAIDKEMAPSESPRVSNAQNSSSLSRKGIEALPTLDRDPLALLIYQPGVQINGANPSSSTINGTRPAMNGIGMDGVSITNPVLPNLDGSLVPVSPDSIS
ncbi:MAG: carboxypeptidase-like regulatory domain-containing protein, partial [Acidobacteriota bacterium]